jgi:S1-C subfamily serine protease
LNSQRGAASNLRLTYREFFGGGDGKPPENFSLSTGRRRRSSRQFPAPARRETVDGPAFRFYSRRMKALLSIIGMLLAMAAVGAGLTSVELNGNAYSNISKVYLGSGGKVIVVYPGGGTSANVDKVPADFLASWNIGQDALAGAKAAAAATAENNLERAIRTGCFREVDGVVYDIRKPQSGWVTFSGVRVLQITDDGAIVDATPDSSSVAGIYVKNLSSRVGDRDFITFSARQTGSHSYINKLGDGRTIRAYDLGRVCDRDEIPELVLSGKKAFAMLADSGTPKTDVIATLPDSENLNASGSGFFISEDGYLVTNHHVVKNARRVKVKTGAGVFPAEVVRVDETNDLALLKVAGHFKPLCISTNDVQLGDPVFTIGFPDITLQGTEPKYTDGKISSLSGIKDDPNNYQISVPVQPGNSGGPLVDLAGSVKGVIVARLNDFAALRSMGSLPQNVNYAVKGKLLRDFISQSPEIKLPVPAATDGSGSAVAAVQQSVAIVLVY